MATTNFSLLSLQNMELLPYRIFNYTSDWCSNSNCVHCGSSPPLAAGGDRSLPAFMQHITVLANMRNDFMVMVTKLNDPCHCFIPLAQLMFLVSRHSYSGKLATCL